MTESEARENGYVDVKGYEGHYMVDARGNVFSLKRNRVMTPCKSNNGYLQVHLTKDGKMKSFKIHRLVAMAFIPNPYNLPQVNHINGNKKDNRVENLEWVSASTNVKHAVSMGLFHISEDKNNWEITEENAIDILNQAILEKNSIVINPRDFGVFKSAFQKVEVE